MNQKPEAKKKIVFVYAGGAKKVLILDKTVSLEKDYAPIGKYKLILQELTSKDSKNQSFIRFGFYKNGKWGSRSAYCFSRKDTIALLAQACKEDEKWRNLLKAALKESEKAPQ